MAFKRLWARTKANVAKCACERSNQFNDQYGKNINNQSQIMRSNGVLLPFERAIRFPHCTERSPWSRMIRRGK